MSTRRQEIRRALVESPMTVGDVAARWRVTVKVAEAEVMHASRSARSEGRRLRVVDPALCVGCGFVFKDRSRLTAPSRCPKCRSEQTTEPLLRIR